MAEKANAIQAGVQPGLRAGVLGKVLLTGLGLSYIVAGSYAAWGFGLGRAGWGGLLVAFLAIAVFYACLVSCLAELATALPVAGGGYAFAHRAFGPFLGFIAGMAITLEYVCAGSALSLFASDYLHSLTGLSGIVPIVVLYLVVVMALVWGVGEALSTTLLLAGFSALGVASFILALAPSFHVSRLFDVPPSGGHGVGFPFGLAGIWAALPFAVTFLIGIEGVPLAAEEAAEPGRTIPVAMFSALAIGVVLALGVLLCGPGSAGAVALLNSPAPMAAALAHASGRIWAGAGIQLLVSVAALVGLVASFFGAMYAGSRMLYALAREGLLPSVLGRVNARGAPWVATLAAAGGLLLAASGLADDLVVLLVFGATLSYLLFLAAHVALRRREPGLERPYRTPGNMAVPALGLVLAATVFIACFLADWKWSCAGAVIIAATSAARWFGQRASACDPLSSQQ